MYWNMINNASYEFTKKFHYAPSKVYMSSWFYHELEKEMVGKQWLALIKQNSVRGLKIVIDDDVKTFVIVGTKY